MSQFERGADALNSLNATNEGNGGSKAEFASFKTGTTFKVRVLGTQDLIRFYSYGIFKKVNSFVAKNPSIKNPKGFPVENLTAWDKAFKHYQDLAFAARDKGDTAAEEEHRNNAYQFKPKERFALGFINLETGEPIIVDLSKKQAQGVHATIVKYEKKLGKIAFELSKNGSGTTTTVSLSPIIDMDEDLSDKERENFAKLNGKDGVPATFDMTLFDGLLYEADEKEQIENLVAAGFNISLIGLSIGGATQADASDDGNIGTVEDTQEFEF